jgi:hypothetical protein
MRVIIYFTVAAQRRAQQNQQGKSLLRHHSLNSHERGKKGGGDKHMYGYLPAKYDIYMFCTNVIIMINW